MRRWFCLVALIGLMIVLQPQAMQIHAGQIVCSSDDTFSPYWIHYSSFFGGNESEWNPNIARDSEGYVYLAFSTTSHDLPCVNAYHYGMYDNLESYDSDIFIAKMDITSNELIYGTYIGGEKGEWVFDLAVDEDGCAYITGGTYSTDFPSTHGDYNQGYFDAFYLKLDSTGSKLNFSRVFGGEFAESGYSIHIINSSYSCLAGYTASNGFPTSNGVDYNSPDDGDVFISSFNSKGEILNASVFGGIGQDEPVDLVYSSSGEFYLLASIASDEIAGTQVEQGWNLVRIDSHLSEIVDSHSFNLESYTVYNDMAMDSNNSVYAVGWTDILDHRNGIEDYQSEMVIAKFDGLSSTITSQLIGGSGNDRALAMDIDSSGNLYIEGWTGSQDFPILRGYNYDIQVGEPSIVAFILSPSNHMLFSSYLGTHGTQARIVCDDSGGFLVNFATEGFDFPLYHPFDETQKFTECLIMHISPTIPHFPSIFPQSDIEFNEGEIGHEIEWHPGAQFPESYQVAMNGANVQTGEWNNSVEKIIVRLDNLSNGRYEYNLSVWDEIGFSASDSLVVDVLPTQPTSSNPWGDPEAILYGTILAGGAIVSIAGVAIYLKRVRQH
ncbi:MAG: hypothetical protein ACFFET_06710 [Candidatus Thorarchaeota archaeon]